MLYDPETKSGLGFTGRKVKGTIHWVCADTALDASCYLYENLVEMKRRVYITRMEALILILIH